MTNLIQYIKLKLRRIGSSPQNEVLDEGELALDKTTKELKIGTSNGESWNNATSLNRIRLLANDNDIVYPGEMVYRNNQLKINLTNSPTEWNGNKITSLNHIKSHTDNNVVLLNQGEMSFNIYTGELFIQGIDNENNPKLFTVNRISLINTQNNDNFQNKELVYDINNKCFITKNENGEIIYNETIPILFPDNTVHLNKLIQNDKIYYFNDNSNPLNGIQLLNSLDETFIEQHYPISNLKYDIGDQKLSYLNEENNEIIMNKAVVVSSTSQDNEDGSITYIYNPDTIYSLGTIIYDSTRNCLLIGLGNKPLSQLQPISGSSQENNTTINVIGITEEEFGSGELT